MANDPSSPLARGIPSRIERVLNEARNSRWISKYAFVQTGFMPLGEGATTQGMPQDANPHQLVWLANLQYGVRKAAQFEGITSWNFLDLGCGTGVPSIYAHLRLGFKRSEGFDIDSRFIEWAKENARRAGVEKDVIFETANASDFMLPDRKYFLFFFNSFGEVTLKAFLETNKDRLEKNRAIICLVNDWAAPLISSMENTSLLFRNVKRNLSLFRFSPSSEVERKVFD